MTFSRRTFSKALLSSIPLAAGASAALLRSDFLMALAPLANSAYKGIRLGTISFSFKELKRTVGEAQWQEVLQDCQQCGLSNLEIEIAKVEPIRTLLAGPRAPVAPELEAAAGTPYGTACVAPARAPQAAAVPTASTSDDQARLAAVAKAREETRQFREHPPANYYANIRKQADAMGITINAYTCGWGSDYTDLEIDGVFTAAKQLGAVAINSSATLEMAHRLAPFADKHKFPVAFHEHLFGLFSNADDYESTLALSPYFRINFDIGHFTASCGDAVTFIRRYHDKLLSIHVKDYKASNGGSKPWGQGDSPIKPVLQFLKSMKYPGVVTIEYDYAVPQGSTSLVEVQRCVRYMKDAIDEAHA
jgi:sugar phosphate isomerase/epimerase